MLNRKACAKFQSQIFDESEVIQILKEVHWHFCKVYTPHTPLSYSKTGVYKGIPIFLFFFFFDPKHRLWVLVSSDAVLTCTHNQ